MIRHQELDLIIQATPREALVDAKSPVNEVLRPDFPSERGKAIILLGKMFGLWQPIKTAAEIKVEVEIRTIHTESVSVKKDIFMNGIQYPDSYSSMLALARGQSGE